MTFFKLAGLAPACEDIHPLFCGAGVVLFVATDLSSCIASQFDTTGNLETSTSCVGSGFVVVLFSFVSVLLDSKSHGVHDVAQNRQTIRQNGD